MVVGTILGINDGCEVGLTLGVRVGSTLGVDVGSLLGKVLGRIEGVTEGADDGAAHDGNVIITSKVSPLVNDTMFSFGSITSFDSTNNISP